MIRSKVLGWLVLFVFVVLQAGCDSSSGVGNHAPVAKSKTVEVEQNKPKDIGLGGVDADNDVLTVIVTQPPQHGTIKNNIFTPERDYYGSDELKFKVTDGKLDSDIVLVTLNIVDHTAPMAIIKPMDESVINSTDELAYFSIKVSEPIKTEILVSDLLVLGGSIHSFQSVEGGYTLIVKPDKNSNLPIKVSLLADKIEDLSGNKNSQSDVALRQVDTQRAFVTVWQTNNEGVTGDKEIEIMSQLGSNNYVIDWGDGKVENVSKRKIKHRYNYSGVYEVKIKGDFPGLYFGEFPQKTDAKKLLKITQWGTIIWSNMRYAFSGCEVMVGEFNDSPDMSDVDDMSFMFSGARVFNSDLNAWDVSSVKYMPGLFYGASRFNQSLTGWNTSNVVNMSKLFLNAVAFNGNIETWDTSKVKSFFSMFKGAKKYNHRLNSWVTSAVENMEYMFYGASNFNHDIGKWDTSHVVKMTGMFKEAKAFNKNITTWDTSKVSTTKFMFERAVSFNQNISTWNMQNNKFMTRMFSGAIKFDQDLSAWNISSAKSMSEMFDGTAMSEDNLKKLNTLWPLL